MKVSIGNTITWSSAAGVMVGVVTNIELNQNAAFQTVPWIDVVVQGKTRPNTIRLCATHQNLVMLKVEVLQCMSTFFKELENISA
jgi:hypothetical protein